MIYSRKALNVVCAHHLKALSILSFVKLTMKRNRRDDKMDLNVAHKIKIRKFEQS